MNRPPLRNDPRKAAAIRALLGMGLHMPGSLVTFEGVPEAADLFNVEAIALTEIDGETKFGGDDRVFRDPIQCCREFVRHSHENSQQKSAITVTLAH